MDGCYLAPCGRLVCTPRRSPFRSSLVTQGILYEIDKFTRIGSYGRTIDNGSDYEAVDCYAISPSVSSDIALSKSVDVPLPTELSTVVYNIVAANLGTGTPTSLQVSDLLPTGVTFLSAAPSQGVYQAGSGNWFVGTVPIGSNATLSISATVDSGTSGSTIVITASVAYLSQTDPASSNDTAAVSISVEGVEIEQTVRSEDDTVSATNPKSIPGRIGQINGLFV